MASPIGGQFVFSKSGQTVQLGLNNGSLTPLSVPGDFNIEVFTALPTSVSVPPTPDSGFQAAVVDHNGQVTDNFLSGHQLFLGGGDYLVTDSVSGSTQQSPAQIWLGTGAQSVVGTVHDTLVGGSANGQVLNALAGFETVLGGSGTESIFGSAFDSITGGTGTQQIVTTGSSSTVIGGGSGAESITAAANDVVGALVGNAKLSINAGANDRVNISNNFGDDNITGAVGTVITPSSGTTQVDATAGFITVEMGTGPASVTGSNGRGGGGVTVLGGSGSLDFNPATVAASGAGDLINLSGSSGNATINAFSFFAGGAHTDLSAVNDTIMASHGADSVWGGPGDWIGAGSVGGAGSGTFDHSSTLAGGVNFGTFDSASAVVYGTSSGQVTVEAVAGASSAKDTVTHFNTATDKVFYADRSASNADASIVATASSSGGDTTIVLPDGTSMTFVGVASAASLKFIG